MCLAGCRQGCPARPSLWAWAGRIWAALPAVPQISGSARLEIWPPCPMCRYQLPNLLPAISWRTSCGRRWAARPTLACGRPNSWIHCEKLLPATGGQRQASAACPRLNVSGRVPAGMPGTALALGRGRANLSSSTRSAAEPRVTRPNAFDALPLEPCQTALGRAASHMKPWRGGGGHVYPSSRAKRHPGEPRVTSGTSRESRARMRSSRGSAQ